MMLTPWSWAHCGHIRPTRLSAIAISFDFDKPYQKMLAHENDGTVTLAAVI
jgi:hypothetical protein